MSGEPHVWKIVACYRSQWLAIAILRGREVLEVRTHQLASLRRSKQRIVQLLKKYLRDYAPSTLVVERRAPFPSIGHCVACPVSLVRFSAAKCLLLRRTERATHQKLYAEIFRHDPRLRRLVTVLPISGRVAQSEHWRTVQLLAIAIGLAEATDNRPAGRGVTFTHSNSNSL